MDGKQTTEQNPSDGRFWFPLADTISFPITNKYFAAL